MKRLDLLNRDLWRCEGAELVSDGKALTIRSPGTFRVQIWQSVTVDLDETPAVAVTVDRMCEVESVEVLFRIADLPRPGYLFESVAPGEFLIPLRGVVGASGIHTFELGLGLRNEWGKGSSTFSEVRLVGAEQTGLGRQPAAPKLITPLAGASVTCFAVEFRWRRTEHAAAYEVQYADNKEFSKAQAATVSTAGGGYYALYINPIPYIPAALPKAGPCYWRVRGLNLRGDPGPWSQVRCFDVDGATEPKQRELAISASRPLILLDNCPGVDLEKGTILSENAAEALPGNWQSLPEEVKKANVLINICGVWGFDALSKVCEVAQEHRIPLLLQVGTWPGIVDIGRHRSLSLSEAECLLQRYSVVKALRLVEQDIVFWGGTGRDERLRYIVKLTRLAAKYGKTVVWAELTDQWAVLAGDAEFISAIAGYKDYFVPVWKATLPEGAHRAQSALLGLWLSGMVSNWGVHADGWWWSYPGFCEHTLEATQDTPASLYCLVWMTGLSAGATVYNIENSWNIWNPPGRLTDKMQRVILPLIREMASRGLIPEKEQVRQKARVACQPGSADLKPLFENTYTVRNPYQFIPATGRYYWIPTLPDYVPQSVLDLFDEVLGSDVFDKPDVIRSIFDRHYPEQPEGNAWAVKVGGRMFAMQSHENKAQEQTFAFELARPFVRLKGILDSHAYVIAKQEAATLFLHVQKGRSDQVKLDVTTTGREPKVSCHGPDGLRNPRWHCDSSSLELVVDQGPSVSIEVSTDA